MLNITSGHNGKVRKMIAVEHVLPQVKSHGTCLKPDYAFSVSKRECSPQCNLPEYNGNEKCDHKVQVITGLNLWTLVGH